MTTVHDEIYSKIKSDQNSECKYISSLHNWDPIKTCNNIIFNGNDHTINGMVIFKPDENNVGFFSQIELHSKFGPVGTCHIHNINFANAVVVGNDNVGILVGSLRAVGNPSANGSTSLESSFDCINVSGEVGGLGSGSAGLIGRHDIIFTDQAILIQQNYDDPSYFSSIIFPKIHLEVNIIGKEHCSRLVGKRYTSGEFKFHNNNDRNYMYKILIGDYYLSGYMATDLFDLIFTTLMGVQYDEWVAHPISADIQIPLDQDSTQENPEKADDKPKAPLNIQITPKKQENIQITPNQKSDKKQPFKIERRK